MVVVCALSIVYTQRVCKKRISFKFIALILTRAIHSIYFKVEQYVAKSQFSILLLDLQHSAQQFRWVLKKPHHQSYIASKQKFLGVFMDVLEYLVRPLAHPCESKIILEVESVSVIDKIEQTLTDFRCEQWMLFPVKSAGIFLECRCRTTIIRELLFVHYCIDIKGVKNISQVKQPDQQSNWGLQSRSAKVRLSNENAVMFTNWPT